MADPGSASGSAKNFVSGRGIINAGHQTNSPVINVIGDHNTSTNSVQMPDARVERLRLELDQVRRLLEGYHSEERSGDREAAIMVVGAVETAVADQRANPDSVKLRSRLDGLIATLTPLIGVIEGIAASIEVFKDIKAAFW
jgi:hypothetical protein